MKKTAVFVMFLSLFWLGCGVGFRSVYKAVIDEPPCYKQFKKVDVSGKAVGYFPVTTDKRGGDSKNQEGVDNLLKVINASLVKKNGFPRLPVIKLKKTDAPDLFVGNADMMFSPTSSSRFDEKGNSIPEMQIYALAPSAEWKTALKKNMQKAQVDYALFITLGMSEYLVSQKNWKGSKELVLGTGYKIPVKWLTSLDDPIQVLHLTGALMDTSGKILHVGAEGLAAAKTASLLQSAVGIQNMFGQNEIDKLRSAVRDDLEGKPLVYNVALWNLLGRLTNRNAYIRQ